jgi:hypothetical protein
MIIYAGKVARCRAGRHGNAIVLLRRVFLLVRFESKA